MTRTFLLKTIIALLLGIGVSHPTLAAAPPGDAAVPPAAPKLEVLVKLKVLVVTGGHGYDTKAFDAMFRANSGIVYHHQQHPKALETIASPASKAFDAIVLYDMVQPITEAQKTAYASRIRGGTGLVVLHHAMANFQAWPEYERMAGGKFFTTKRTVDGKELPPSGYRHDVDIPVEIADPDHFITRGLKDFTIHDETYSRFGVDPAVHVLLRTKHPESGPVLAWTKPYGKARVVTLQLGHDGKAYNNPNYRTLVSRSIRWVARRTEADAAMKPIFNGKDLSGWKAFGNARFTVEDGILVGRQGPGGAAGDLFSMAAYDDFELEASWAMDWPGNSGIWFRYQSGAKAYQADILEYKNPLCWSGSLYCGGKMFIAMNKDPSILSKTGWNTFRIRAVKDHLVIHLNGRKVADIHDNSSPGGRLGLQVHAGAPFANMAIRIADLRIREVE